MSEQLKLLLEKLQVLPSDQNWSKYSQTEQEAALTHKYQVDLMQLNQREAKDNMEITQKYATEASNAKMEINRKYFNERKTLSRLHEEEFSKCRNANPT